jgi:hypothetical protein
MILPGVRDLGVVRAAEARDRVEQDHDVLAELDEPLGLLDHHLRDRTCRLACSSKVLATTSPQTVALRKSVTSSGRSSTSSTMR